MCVSVCVHECVLGLERVGRGGGGGRKRDRKAAWQHVRRSVLERCQMWLCLISHLSNDTIHLLGGKLTVHKSL